jgi:hypothetical protein
MSHVQQINYAIMFGMSLGFFAAWFAFLIYKIITHKRK